jgi:tetratricopeptide (TPR) repeat protein
VGAVILLVAATFVPPSFAQQENITPASSAAEAKYNELMDRGFSASATRDLSKAEAVYSQALALADNFPGDNDIRVQMALGRLVVILDGEDKYKETEELYRRILAIQEKDYGVNSSDVALTLMNLSIATSMQKKYAESEAFAQRAIGIDKATLGDMHPVVASDLLHLANTYSDAGDQKKAEELYKEALHIKENTLQQDPISMLDVLNSLAACYCLEKNYAESGKVLDRVLPLVEKNFGPDHPEMAESLSRMGCCQAWQKHYDKAESYLLRAEAIATKYWGPDQGRVIPFHDKLAVNYRNEGKWADAEREYKIAAESAKEIWGATSPETAKRFKALAECRQDQPSLTAATWAGTASDKFVYSRPQLVKKPTHPSPSHPPVDKQTPSPEKK